MKWFFGVVLFLGIVVAGYLLVPSGPEPMSEPAPVRDIVGTETKLYSQLDEELVIRDYFQDRRDGVFLDIGCAWPIKGSTTYYLEEHLGWSGIGVDANPDYAASWKKDRPRSKYFTYLVSDHSGTMDTFYAAETLGSVQKDREIFGQIVEGVPIEVPSITMDDLLEANGIESIDFLSMDIEESEPQALAGFDIERFAPKLVCIEASPSIRTRILEYFTAHGYRRIDRYLEVDQVNWYFEPVPAE
jgi:FkbM family methyltransferase